MRLELCQVEGPEKTEWYILQENATSPKSNHTRLPLATEKSLLLAT